MTPGPGEPSGQDLPHHWLRGVVLFLSGQTVSLLGSAIVSYAVIWHLALTTGSGTIYALAVVASQLTMGLICLPGGIWADRYWRKPLIIGADGAVAVVTAVMAVLYLAGHQQLWLIVALLGLRGLGSGVQSPAVGATLPQITPVQHLMRVNSVNASVQAAMFVAAPAVAAVLLTWMSLGWILLLDVCTALIGIGFTLAVPIPRLARRDDAHAAEHRGARAYVHEIRLAWDGVRHHAGLLRIMVLLAAMSVVVFPLAQMTPVFVVHLFGNEQWMLAAVEITWSVYQTIVAAYRDTDKHRGKRAMSQIIDKIRAAVPKGLTELAQLGRTLHRRRADILAWFDHPGSSNGPTEAINGRLEHLRGIALGFRNLVNYRLRSLLEAGGFRPLVHSLS